MNITQHLERCRDGDRRALDELYRLVYPELRRIARRELARRHSAETLNPTGLIHEAYLRLVDQNLTEYQSRAHFYAVAARVMRHVLVDRVRYRLAAKRGGGSPANPDFTLPGAPQATLEQILSLNRALDHLSELNQRLARVVDLRYFCGFSFEETGEILGIDPRTAKRDWQAARGFLLRELRKPLLPAS